LGVVVAAAVASVVAAVVTAIITVVPISALVVLAASTTASLKTAALLARLVLGTDAGANTDRLAALGKGCTASGGAVGGPETLAADELAAGAVSYVLLAAGVGDVLPEREIRGGLDGGDGHW
jgi:hypothetical protein